MVAFLLANDRLSMGALEVDAMAGWWAGAVSDGSERKRSRSIWPSPTSGARS
jgi:hypothetical protein